MERSHLQPQVVFQHTAEIEGKSQAALEAKLHSAAVRVLYTELKLGGWGVKRKDSKQREEKE